MGGRRKLTLLIAGLAVLVLAGGFGVLAKTGKLKMFASTTDQVELTITAKYSDGVPWSNQDILVDRYRVLGEDLELAGSQTTDNQGVAKFILQKNYFYNFNTAPPQAATPSCRGALLNYYSVRSESKAITIGCTSSSDPVTSQTFTFKGRTEVHSGNVLVPVPGATVELTITGTDNKVTGISGANGEITLQNVPIVSGKYSSEYKVNVSKTGYEGREYDFNYLFTSAVTPFEAGREYRADRSILMYASEATPTPTPTPTASVSVTPDANENIMKVVGKIWLEGTTDSQLVGGVTLNASCTRCAQGPWSTVSSNTVLGTVRTKEFNFAIDGVYNPAAQSAVENTIYIDFSKEEYYYDTDRNGQYNAQIDNRVTIPATNNSRSPYLDPQTNQYISYLDLPLKRIAAPINIDHSKINLTGKVYDDISKNLVGDVTISATPAGFDKKHADSNENFIDIPGVSGSYNYLIENLYNIAQESTLAHEMLIEIFPRDPNYYYDSNQNNTFEADDNKLILHDSEITPFGGGPIQLATKDFPLKQKESITSEISGIVTDRGDKPLGNVQVFARKNGFLGAFGNPGRVTLEGLAVSEFQAYTDADGKYKIIIPSSDIGATLGTGYQVCAIPHFPGSDIDSIGCYDSADRIRGIKVYRNKKYDAPIKLYSYDKPDFTKFEIRGTNRTIDGRGIAGQTVQIKINMGMLVVDEMVTTASQGLEDFDEGEYFYSFRSETFVDEFIASEPSRRDSQIELTFSKTSDQFGGLFIDKNHNFIDDDGENKIILDKDNLRYDSAKGVIYFDTTQEFTQIYAGKTQGTFGVYAKFVTQGKIDQVIPGAKLTVSYDPLQYHREAVSVGRVSQFEQSDITPIEYNLSLENIFLFDNDVYTINIIPPEGFTFTDESQAYHRLSTEQINVRRGVVALRDIELKPLVEGELNLVMFPVKFILAADGSEVRIQDVFEDFRSGFDCMSATTNELDSCSENTRQDSERNLLVSELDPEKYHHSRAVLFTSYSNARLFPSDDILYVPPTPTIENPAIAYLIDYENRDSAIFCKNIFGVDFCTLAKNKGAYFTPEREANMLESAKIIKALAQATNTPIPDVFLLEESEGDFWGPAWAAPTNDGLMAGDYDTEFSIGFSPNYFNNSFDRNGRVNTTIHEFGHIVDFSHDISYSSRFGDDLSAAFESSRLYACNFLSVMSEYAVFTDQYEFFAEFFTQWIIDGNSIKNAISNPEPGTPVQCVNNLKYLYKLMREQFPGLPMYTFDSRVSYSPGSIGICANKQENASPHKTLAENLMGELTTERALADSSFNQDLLGLGFTGVDSFIIETVAPLRNLSLTPEQIANGEFLKQVYTSLPLQRKVGIQANIALNKTKNMVSGVTGIKTFPSIRDTVQRLNDDIETILKRIGIKFSTSKIYGTVLDQKNTPLSRVVVTVGKKSDVTNDNGYFQINRLKDGENVVKIVDPNTGKIYYNRRIQVQPDQPIKQDIVVTRPRYRIRGTVTKNDQPLNEGQVQLKSSDGKISYFPIDADGKFSIWRPEGKYQLKILDSNKKIKQVISSTNINNSNALILKDANIDTSIKIQ